jgi:hypothetical protein
MECYRLEVMGNTVTLTDQKGTGSRYEIPPGIEDDQIVALLIADEDRAGILAVGLHRREARDSKSKDNKQGAHG